MSCVKSECYLLLRSFFPSFKTQVNSEHNFNLSFLFSLIAICSSKTPGKFVLNLYLLCNSCKLWHSLQMITKRSSYFFCWSEKSVFWRVFLKYCFLDVSLHCQFVWGVVSLTALYIFCRAIRILGSILIVLSDCPGENSPSISLGSENVCNTTIVPFQGDINQTTQSSVSFFLKPFFVLLFLYILANLCSINFIFKEESWFTCTQRSQARFQDVEAAQRNSKEWVDI